MNETLSPGSSFDLFVNRFRVSWQMYRKIIKTARIFLYVGVGQCLFNFDGIVFTRLYGCYLVCKFGNVAP